MPAAKPLPQSDGLGMYHDTSCGLQVGEFNIRPQREGMLWFERAGGEGGEFSIELFEAAVRKFYSEHF